MIFPSSLEGTYRQKQVTIIQTARTTLQITNLTHNWVRLQSSYVWRLQYFIRHIMTSCIHLDLKFSVLKLHGWSPWEDVILLVVKASQVLGLMIDTVLLHLLLYTWFIPSDMIKYVLWSDLTKTEKLHHLSVIMIWSAVMRKRSLICFNSTLCECATYFWSKCVTRVWIS